MHNLYSRTGNYNCLGFHASALSYRICIWKDFHLTIICTASLLEKDNYEEKVLSSFPQPKFSVGDKMILYKEYSGKIDSLKWILLFLKPSRFRKSAQQWKKPWIYLSSSLIQTENLTSISRHSKTKMQWKYTTVCRASLKLCWGNSTQAYNLFCPFEMGGWLHKVNTWLS